MFNHLIRKNDLEAKHQLLYEGDKIKFLYLKEPNPVGINVITFQSEIPKVFGLEKYLNYDLQFQKAFLDPLDSLIKCVGWEIKEQASLEWLFE